MMRRERHTVTLRAAQVTNTSSKSKPNDETHGVPEAGAGRRAGWVSSKWKEVLAGVKSLLLRLWSDSSLTLAEGSGSGSGSVGARKNERTTKPTTDVRNVGETGKYEEDERALMDVAETLHELGVLHLRRRGHRGFAATAESFLLQVVVGIGSV